MSITLLNILLFILSAFIAIFYDIAWLWLLGIICIPLALRMCSIAQKREENFHVNMIISALCIACCCFSIKFGVDAIFATSIESSTKNGVSSQEIVSEYYCAQIISTETYQNRLGITVTVAEFDFGSDIKPDTSQSSNPAIQAQIKKDQYTAGDIVILELKGIFETDLSKIDDCDAEIIGLRDVIAPDAELGLYRGQLRSEEIIVEEIEGAIKKWNFTSPDVVSVTVETHNGSNSYLIRLENREFNYEVGDLIKITTHNSMEGYKFFRITDAIDETRNVEETE